MSITAQGSGSGLYQIETGPFRGLFNAEPATAIPDEYLYDMENLEISELGALKSVLKPSLVDWHPNAGALGGAIRSIGCYGLYIGQQGTLCDNQGTTKITATGIGDLPVVRHLGTYYALGRSTSGGLYDAMTGVHITAATTGFPASNGFFAFAVYEMRMWLGIDNTLRGSADGQDLEAETEINGGRTVWGPWVGPNMDINMVFPEAVAITHLIPTQNGLLIFSNEEVFSMATFWGGKAVPIYHGSDLPHSNPANFVLHSPYSDGQTVYYASDRALFAFGSAPRNISSVLLLPRIYAFSCGEYRDRIWFLVCTTEHPAGEQANYIYAVNKYTGYWEKYDIQMTAKSGSTYNTPTALIGGLTGIGETMLMIGTSIGTIYDWYGTMTDYGALPWSVTTKAFSPSFDQPHAPIKFRIDYISQAAASPVVVTTYLDGVAVATTITFDMTDGVGGAFLHREFDIPSNLTANSVQFLIEGTGHAEIMNLGYSLSIYPVGDTNP